VEGEAPDSSTLPRDGGAESGARRERAGAAPPVDLVGRRILHFQVLAHLGQGGMGVVYEALDEKLRRRVALKVLRARYLADERNKELMFREARNAAAIAHPNVAAIYDVHDSDELAFIAMELVKGRTLRARVAAGPLSADEALRIAREIAEGLAAAHATGVVHRDLKPDNVMLTPEGRVKLLDFGIAKVVTDGEAPVGPSPGGSSPPLGVAPTLPASGTHTREGRIVGTPAYMAPEQARGEPVDASADVFSFGALLYELLAGEAPFSHRTTPVREWGGDGSDDWRPRAPLRERRRDVPRELATIVAHCLEVRPERRYADGAELVRALSAVRARRAGWRQGVAAVAILALLAAGAAVVDRTYSGARTASTGGAAAGGAPPGAPPGFGVVNLRRLTFDEGCAQDPSFFPDGRTLAYDAYGGASDRLMTLDVSTGARQPLHEGRGWEVSPKVSRDGARIAYVVQRGDVVEAWVMSADGTGARKITTGPALPTWSFDDRAIWAGTEALLQRFDADTGEPTRTARAPMGFSFVDDLELADGRLVTLQTDRDAHVIDRVLVYPPDGGPEVELWRGTPIEDVIALLPDRDAVVVSKVLPTHKHELWRVPLDGAPPAPLAAAGIEAAAGLTFSPDLHHMVWSTCSSESVISQVDPTGGSALPLFPKHDWSDVEAVGIPGTNRLVVLSDRGGTRAPWVLDAAGREPARRIDVGDRVVSELAVSPDGQLLAFTSKGRGIEVMPLDGSAAPWRLTDAETDTSPSFSADGKRVYFEMHDERAPKIAVAETRSGASPARKILLQHAAVPASSPTQDLLVYSTGLSADQVDVRVLDVKSGRSRPLSPAIGRGWHMILRFSTDGKRVAVIDGLNGIVEVDVESGAVVRRFHSSYSIVVFSYTQNRLIVTSTVLSGDLWMGDVTRDP
jgi:Tol biopolymer transport system component